jgi:hypothetical protein
VTRARGGAASARQEGCRGCGCGEAQAARRAKESALNVWTVSVALAAASGCSTTRSARRAGAAQVALCRREIVLRSANVKAAPRAGSPVASLLNPLFVTSPRTSAANPCGLGFRVHFQRLRLAPLYAGIHSYKIFVEPNRFPLRPVARHDRQQHPNVCHCGSPVRSESAFMVSPQSAARSDLFHRHTKSRT